MSCDRVICNPLSSTNTLGLCSTNGSMTFPRQHHFPLVSSRRGTGRGGNMAHSLGSLRRSHTDEPTNYMSLRGIESVGYAGSVQPGALPNAGNDQSRTSNLHSWTTEYDGQPSRMQRYRGDSQIVSAAPVTFERKINPNKYLDAPDIQQAREVKVVDKHCDRIVEVFQKKPVAKMVERMVEKIEIQDAEKVSEFQVTQVVPEIQYVDKEVFYDREVLKEEIEEVYVDKYVERVVEILREVPVDKIVERRMEVVKEVPVVRYVDRVVTKEVPVVQVVERVVEVLKERPVEVVKEVPVYVRRDASDLEANSPASYQKLKAASEFTYGPKHSARNTFVGDVVNAPDGSKVVSASMQRASIGSPSSYPTTSKAGVGMVLEREANGEIFLRRLMQGSPAYNDGSLRVGDKLLAVDDVNVQGMRLDSVFAVINGAEGTGLKLTMMRNGAAFAVSLTRGQVQN